MGQHLPPKVRRGSGRALPIAIIAAGLFPCAAFLFLSPDAGLSVRGDRAPGAAIVAAGQSGAEVRYNVDPEPADLDGETSGAEGDRVLAMASRGARGRIPEALPVGVAPEAGLQINTVRVARAVSAAFPEIKNIGGVRPDSMPWHPNGLAIDIMIPNWGTDEGVALGNEIRDFVLSNAERFGLQDVIWNDTYYTPSGPAGSGNGHFDHVHVTTTGGGYPTGDEAYYR